MSIPTSVPQPQAEADTILIVDYYLDGDTLIIASATTPGRLYIVTPTSCSCPAGQADFPCQHANYWLDLLRPKRTPERDSHHVGLVRPGAP